jgi:hypothetical protein
MQGNSAQFCLGTKKPEDIFCLKGEKNEDDFLLLRQICQLLPFHYQQIRNKRKRETCKQDKDSKVCVVHT